MYWIQCSSCGARGPYGETMHEAIQRWEKRFPPHKSVSSFYKDVGSDNTRENGFDNDLEDGNE